MKAIFFLLALSLGLSTTSVKAADLSKVDPLFLSALEQARADEVSPRDFKLEVFVAVEGQYTEKQIRKIFSKAKVESRSVLLGDMTIVTAMGTLAALMKLTDHPAIITIETSRVIGKDPSVSVGN